MRAVESKFEARPLRRPTASAALPAFALLLVGSVQLCLAGPSSQATFPSPDDASRALFAAVQKHDERAVTEILGAGTELISSDDTAQDTLDRERFVQKYQEMHRLVREPGGVTALYIGAENWPFPIPLVSRNGVWHFDSDGGANEIRFRRIGENEVTAIGICHALVATEMHPGTDSEADGLVKTVLPHVQDANTPVPFHGYYFRILSNSHGGFAAIAYPAIYGSSGVMSFIVNQDDGVSEKDLGANTAKVAGAMTSYPSDPTWTPAESTP
jgi:Protein of unknown function (DUF2950)